MPALKSFYAKLAIGLAAVLLLVGLVFSLFAGFLAEELSRSTEQVLNRDLAERLVSDNRIVKGDVIDEQAMKDTFMMYMSINPDIEIYYLDLQGNILAYSAEPGKVKRQQIDLEPVRQFLQGAEHFPLLGDDPRGLSLQKPFSVTPIPNRQNPLGYLYVVLLGEQYTAARDSQAGHYALSLGAAVLAGSLLLGLCMGLYIFNRMTLRLRNLQKQVSRFVASDFQQPALLAPDQSADVPDDEVEELHRDVASMGERITNQWLALKQQDKLRRELVANISHDLRTPLTSIQGYMETLALKDDTLDTAQRQEYLSIAIRESRRLHKLIDDLLELAKLEACERQPELETFPILELIHDVVNKLTIRAETKDITLEIQAPACNPLVIADLGLIERVLDNLISNSICYTGEQGHVRIQVDTPRDNQVLIRVGDTGKGIPPSQHELVFERFHQAHAKDRSNGHAGLGLAIVQKILELHQQKIWVNSAIDEGAEFNFTLTTAS